MHTSIVTKIKTSFAVVLCAFLLCTVFVPTQAFAQNTVLDTLIGTNKKCNYIQKGLYQPYSDINAQFPVFGTLINSEGCIKVSSEVNDMFATGFKVFLGVVSLIAVVNIAVSGIQWMITEKSLDKKRSAKKRLTDSIVGLILALIGWAILYTVNPKLLDIGLDLSKNPLSDLIQKGARSAANNIQPVQEGDCIPGTPGCGVDGRPTGTTGTAPSNSNLDTSTGGLTKGEGHYFKNKDWAAKARELVVSTGLASTAPLDAQEFFPPNGQPTVEGWVRLIEEVVYRESGFNPNTTYLEPDFGYNSVGLLQMSAVDAQAKKRGYKEQDLKDPYKNLEVGIATMKVMVDKYGCISCGKLKGAAAYWSVLNTPQNHRNGKRASIIASLRAAPGAVTPDSFENTDPLNTTPDFSNGDTENFNGDGPSADLFPEPVPPIPDEPTVPQEYAGQQPAGNDPFAPQGPDFYQ